MSCTLGVGKVYIYYMWGYLLSMGLMSLLFINCILVYMPIEEERELGSFRLSYGCFLRCAGMYSCDVQPWV